MNQYLWHYNEKGFDKLPTQCQYCDDVVPVMLQWVMAFLWCFAVKMPERIKMPKKKTFRLDDEIQVKSDDDLKYILSLIKQSIKIIKQFWRGIK